MLYRLIVSVVCALVCAVGLAAEKPNVLFLAVDDMNDWIGCLDSVPQAITPNLNRLAARGANFTNAHTAGVFCAPSRAAIFSGQFASTINFLLIRLVKRLLKLLDEDPDDRQ